MKTIFSLDNDVLGRLDAVTATKTFRNLLWCEARRIGISPHKVVISLKANVSDGGIDARVDGSPKVDSVLVDGITYFQIKTGQGFKPWQKSSLKKELFGSSRATPARKFLAPEIRECLRSRGRYVIASYGHDLTSQQNAASKGALKDLLAACGFKKAKVDVLGQSQLLGLFVSYPSLTLELGGKGDVPFLSISAWQARDDMKPSLQLGPEQLETVNSIRSAVRDIQYQHVRIIGEPGIGKTRLVLEAISTDDLAPAVIYVPHVEDFQNSRLLNELIRGDIGYSATLVVDECIEKERASIWSALKGKVGVKLVTIDHGPEGSRDNGMLVLECPKLPEDQIKAILAQYLPKHTDASHWARWCDGIPRVAHAVGENLQRNPADLLKPPATVPLWERFVAGYEGLDSKNAKDVLAVLRHIALFTRFGFEEPVSNEARFIAALVQLVDPSITWARFQEIVDHLRGRRILQGKRTLFIVPKALHIYLWVDYWKVYGRGFNFQEFFDKVPRELRHWFLQLFIYGHASPVARDVIANILSPTGPFSSRDFLESDAGCRFLNYLAEADPSGVLAAIERTFGSWSLDELKRWGQGRQDIVWALEKIAVWREHFLRVATVLVGLASAENASNSNNSTGILLGLFVVGTGWAATQASPSERFPVIQQLLASEDTEHRQLGLKLCESWLSARGGIRIVGAEYQGLRSELEFWRPKLWKEVFDAWRLVWRHVYTVSQGWSRDERTLANITLIDSGAELLHVSNVANEVMETIFSLVDDPATDVRHLTHMAIHQLRFRTEKMPKGIPGKLRTLDKKLTGKTFWGRFCRYVLNTTWGEDYRARKGEIKESEAPSRRVQELVEEVAKNATLFSEYLPKFVEADGHRLYEFGMKLAEAIQSEEIVGTIISAQVAVPSKRKTQFIAGFFAGVKTGNSLLWEAATLRLLEDSVTREIGIAIVFSSGFSERVLAKTLALYKEGSVAANVFSSLAWRASSNDLPETMVSAVLEALVSAGDNNALHVGAELAKDYYFDKQHPRSCDESLIWRLITSEAIFHDDVDTMTSYYWRSIAKSFRARFPSRDIDLLSAILIHLKSTHSDECRLADEIARDHPKESWTIASKLLESEDKNGYWITAWLGDRIEFDENPPRGTIRYFDPTQVMAWVYTNPGHNTRMLLRCLPKTLDENEGGKLTALFLEAYGDDEKISLSLISHFMSGGWSGPASAHHKRKRDRARVWVSQTKSGKVLSWLYRYIDELNHRITAAEISEEREF